MASLRDLNSFSQQGFVYNDSRTPLITYSNLNPGTQTISAIESLPHIATIGSDITEIHSNSITFKIDVSSLPGATVTWPSTTAQNIILSTPSNGVYTAGNIFSINQWNSVKGAVIHASRDRIDPWSYQLTITPTSGNVVTWTNNVTIRSMPKLSNVANILFDKMHSMTITGNPTIIDTEVGGNYTMYISPNTTSAVTSITSSLGSFNNSTKTLTIVGTKDQINTDLGNIWLTPNTAWPNNFYLNYQLIDPVSNFVSNASQYMTNSNVYPYMSNISVARTYKQNTPAPLFNANIPQILGPDTDTYRIEFALDSNIGYIGDVLTKTNWNSGNLTYSVTGSKSTINSMMANIYFVPNRDTITNANITITEWENGISQGNTITALTGSTSNVSLSPRIYTFTSGSNTFAPSLAEQAYLIHDVLLIAGGGSGGALGPRTANTGSGGGGGAGGTTYFTNAGIFNNHTYTINVGAGGLIQQNNSGAGTPWIPHNGGDSTITLNGTIIKSVNGGGYGASNNYDQANGGSGGGAMLGGGTINGTAGGASGISGQGYSGGNSIARASGSPYISGYVPGGGGGAGGAGSSSASGTAIPGAGNTYTISGNTVTYSRGGADAFYTGLGSPQPGDGGNGGVYSSFDYSQSNNTTTATSGQNGIVILRFY